jgi:hypothetical protein
VKARLSGAPAPPESTVGREELGSSSEYGSSACCGMATAMVGADVAGTVVLSIELILDMETGLVWMLSLAPVSGISIFCAISATGSLSWVAAPVAPP